ncbi:hypothetical protein D3C71_1212010 [compost metagenome]
MAVLVGHDVGDDPVAHVLARLDGGRAKVRQQHDVGAAHQAGMHRRFMLEHIQTDAEQGAAVQGLDQGGLVDQFAARRVHEDGVGLQPGDALGRKDVVRILGRRAVQRDDVHPRQHLIQIVPPGRAQFLGDHVRDGFAVVIMDLHPKGLGPAGQGLADAAHADDAQTLAPQLAAAHPGRAPALELTRRHDIGAFDDAAADGHDQAHGQVGRVLGQDARRIGDDDPAPHGGVDVDVIHARAEVGDHLQLLARPLDEVGVQMVGDGRDQDLGALQGGGQVVARHRPVGQIQFGVEQFAQTCFHRIGQASG